MAPRKAAKRHTVSKRRVRPTGAPARGTTAADTTAQLAEWRMLRDTRVLYTAGLRLAEWRGKSFGLRAAEADQVVQRAAVQLAAIHRKFLTEFLAVTVDKFCNLRPYQPALEPGGDPTAAANTVSLLLSVADVVDLEDPRTAAAFLYGVHLVEVREALWNYRDNDYDAIRHELAQTWGKEGRRQAIAQAAARAEEAKDLVAGYVETDGKTPALAKQLTAARVKRSASTVRKYLKK